MAASTFNIGVVIGAAIGKSYFNAFDHASNRAKKLGSALKSTNAQLKAADDVVKYGKKLGELQRKQADLGYSSERLKEHCRTQAALQCGKNSS